MLATALLLALLPQADVQDSEGITGLVEVPAGRVYVGAPLDEVKELCKQNPDSAVLISGWAPQTAENQARFFIGPTEVTNEQYLQFVNATGHVPPATWAQLTREQRLEIITEEQKKNPAFVLDEVGLAKWWAENWQNPEYKWEMPASAALEPVVFVSYQDAQAYCRWSGLRLPTEQEWTRAARGDSRDGWPFGAKFDEKLVSSVHTEPKDLAHKRLWVNTFPGNASPFGCVDMVGNVWEWTDSPYNALEDFKSFRVTDKNDKELTPFPDFRADRAVIRGGSFMNEDYVCRIDARAGIDKPFSAPLLGFRVAAYGVPTADVVRLVTNDLNTRALGGAADTMLDLNRPIGVERREYADLAEIAKQRGEPAYLEDINKRRGESKEKLTAPEPPEGYAVISGYRAVGMAPYAQLDFPNYDKLARECKEKGPIRMAVLHTTEPLSSPNLTPGVYVVGFLGALDLEEIAMLGAQAPAKDADEFQKIKDKLERRDEKPSAELPDMSGIVLQPNREHVVFINNDHQAKAAMQIEKPQHGSARRVEEGVILNLERDLLEFRIAVFDSRASRIFSFKIPVTPHGKDGSLVKKDYWSGPFLQVVEPKPDEATGK